MGTAYATVDGKSYRGCWTLLPDGRVLVRYDDGDSGLVMISEFKPEPGI